MKIGYVRVSTIEQNEERQVEALKKQGVEKWFIDTASGKNTNRTQLEDMLEFAREGDTVYIHSLDRLARSTKDLLNIVEDLDKRNIRLISNKESIDTSTAMGKLMLNIVGAIAEFERENLLERQKEGIELAKKAGKYKGRKRIEYPDNWVEVYNKWNSREITAVEAMELTGLKKNTFYNLLKQYQEKQSEEVEEVKESTTVAAAPNKKEESQVLIDILKQKHGIVEK